VIVRPLLDWPSMNILNIARAWFPDEASEISLSHTETNPTFKMGERSIFKNVTRSSLTRQSIVVPTQTGLSTQPHTADKDVHALVSLKKGGYDLYVLWRSFGSHVGQSYVRGATARYPTLLRCGQRGTLSRCEAIRRRRQVPRLALAILLSQHGISRSL
jgi:hypothetical protein